MKRQCKGISLLLTMAILVMMLLMQSGLASAASLPTISPNGGNFTASQSVTIGNIPSGDTASYTTDETNPTTSSTAVTYSGAFTVSQSETVWAAVYDPTAGSWSGVAEATFTISSTDTPTVETNNATSLAATSATLNGDITDNGSDVISSYGFSYSTDQSSWTKASAGTDDTTGSFTYDLTGLASGTAYYYKAYATNPEGTSYGDVVSFTTLTQTTVPAAPAISPNGGNFTASQSVTIGNIPSGDTASYTTDETNPTTSSTAVTYSGAFTVSQSETIKAAVHDPTAGWGSVATATFTISITPPTTSTLTFSDVPTTYWAYDAINQLYSKGLASGYPDNTFRPDNTITRAEFVSMLVKAINLTVTTPATPTFTDVASGDWYFGAVEAAVKDGLIKGYANNEFLPNAPIDRQEITAVLAQAMGTASGVTANTSATTNFTDNAKIADWARSFVANAVQAGLIQGYPDNSFGPLKNATRAEACVMINNLLGIKK